MKRVLQTQKIFYAMGTANSVVTYDGTTEALSAAEKRVKEIERRMSAFRNDSDVSAVNENAGIRPVIVSEDTFRLLKHAVMYSEYTDGYFDVTAGPLSFLWKEAIRTGNVPGKDEIENAKCLTDYRDIILDHENQTVMLKRKGQRIDPGAIAKGYAADEAAKVLKTYGVRNAVINFGGTVVNLGQKRNVGIQRPFAPEGEFCAYLKNVPDGRAVVSSGMYEQFSVTNGKRIHHITDVKTGLPSDSGLIGVTLTGDRAEELDALATAVFVMGAEKSVELLKVLDIGALFITDKYEVLVNEKLGSDLVM